MLRLNQHSSVAAAKTYYRSMIKSSLGKYYHQEQAATPNNDPAIGRVDGKLADRLNLAGGMTQDQFDALIEGQAVDPQSGQKLRKRQNRDGKNRIGLDLTFDPGGKSLSAYYAGTQDPLIPKLFDEARHETMILDVEPRMLARVRKNGASHSKRTGVALWTSFPDLVTRPTKLKNEQGKWVETFTVDPHIHDHNYIFQYTWDADYVNRDGSLGTYLSADTSKIFSSMPYIQKAFHARLFKKLKDHGFNVQQTEHGIELEGWNDQMSTTFSRRKEEIDDWAKKRGIESPEGRDRVGKWTRSGKVCGKLTTEQQFEEWQDRLSQAQWTAFIRAATDSGTAQINRVVDIDQAIDYGLEHALERSNSATVEEVLTAALDVGMGLDVERLKRRLLERDDVVAAWFGNDLLITTQAMALREEQVLDRATRSQASCLALGGKDFRFSNVDLGDGNPFELNEDQKRNLRKLLASRSRFMTLRGAPGVGKTAALATQFFRAVEENGGTVLTLGSTSNARDQLIAFGSQSGSYVMQNAVTLASFLDDQESHATLTPDTLVVLDEASLAGLKDLDELTQIIDRSKARLLLVGDYRQMDAVQAHAKIFEQLCGIGGHGEFKEIVRQKDPDYRRAAMLTASGDEKDVRSGFDKLTELGFVRQIDDRKDRLEQAAQVYLDITGEKKHRRGKRLEWTKKEKQDPSNYRSGMTLIRDSIEGQERYEVVGRKNGNVMAVRTGSTSADAKIFDLVDVSNLSVYEANYNDAILIVGTHKDGEAVTAKIRNARRQHGELGRENQFNRLESIGLSNAQKKQSSTYTPAGQTIEFTRKAKAFRPGSHSATRTIKAGERFQVSGVHRDGEVLMCDTHGKLAILPRQYPERFDVYQEKQAKVAIGDKIRMTKGGNMLPDGDGKKGVRFSNNDVFTVSGFDTNGNPIVNTGHRIAKEWMHWRSGYYKTSMAAQGSTSSHNIFLDSQRAGRARSSESWLVSITRGKHAATILTDDMQGLRNRVITRTSQRPSGTEVKIKSQAATTSNQTQQSQQLPKQAQRLSRIDSFAAMAMEATWHVIRRQAEQILGQAKHLLPLFKRHERPAS